MKKINNSAIFTILILVVVDQISKYLIRQSGGFYICNKGVAFGINFPESVFWSLWLIIFGAVIFYAIKEKSNWVPFSFIIAGALSNVIDRIYFGCVIDFINLKIWPLFNLADTFIVIGAILLIVSKIKKEK